MYSTTSEISDIIKHKNKKTKNIKTDYLLNDVDRLGKQLTKRACLLKTCTNSKKSVQRLFHIEKLFLKKSLSFYFVFLRAKIKFNKIKKYNKK
jgi:hypothetical protein